MGSDFFDGRIRDLVCNGALFGNVRDSIESSYRVMSVDSCPNANPDKTEPEESSGV